MNRDVGGSGGIPSIHCSPCETVMELGVEVATEIDRLYLLTSVGAITTKKSYLYRRLYTILILLYDVVVRLLDLLLICQKCVSFFHMSVAHSECL